MAATLPEMMNIEMLNKTILCYAETIYRFNGLWEGPDPLTPLISLFLIQLTFSMGVIHLLVFALKPFNQPPFVAEVLVSIIPLTAFFVACNHMYMFGMKFGNACMEWMYVFS